MKICSLYEKGELIDWNDRVCIAHLAGISWIPGHLEFLEAYGEGEFARTARFHSPKNILESVMTKNIVEIASLDIGVVVAEWHVDRYLLEFTPRHGSQNSEVFTTFEELLSWLLRVSELGQTLPLYEQPNLPSMSFSANKKGAQIDEKLFAQTIGDEDISIGRWSETKVFFTKKIGVLFELDDFGTGSLRYRLDCPCVHKIKRTIEGAGFVHQPSAMEDYFLEHIAKS